MVLKKKEERRKHFFYTKKNRFVTSERRTIFTILAKALRRSKLPNPPYARYM